jgi:molecular chaperone DnaJ
MAVLTLSLLLLFASSVAAAFLLPHAAALAPPRPAAARFARTACICAMADAADYYSALGLQPDASPAEVKRAYRRAALRSHPDVNKAPDAQAVFARVVRR